MNLCWGTHKSNITFCGMCIENHSIFNLVDYLSIIYLCIYIWLYSPLLDLGQFFNFLIVYTEGRTPRTSDQPVARPLPAHRITQTENKFTQTSMLWVGFEPMIPSSERAKESSCLRPRGHRDRHTVRLGIFIAVLMHASSKETIYHSAAVC
jgi:hypothetical protein